MGKGFKKAVKGIGKAVGGGLKIAAPFAAAIPGVGPLAAAGLGAGARTLGRALSGQRTFDAGDILKTGALAGAGGFATGGKGFAGFKKSGIYKTLGKTFMQPGGGLNLERVAGVGMGAANLIGARKQRQSAERFNNAQTDIRNQLLSRILAQPQYNFKSQ